MIYTQWHGFVWLDGVLRPDKSDAPVFDYDVSITPQMLVALRSVEDHGPSLWHEPHHVVLGDGSLRLAVLGEQATPYVLWAWPPYSVSSYTDFWYEQRGIFITTLFGGENDFVGRYTCAYRPTPSGVIVELREPAGTTWQGVVGDCGVLPLCPTPLIDEATLALA